MEVGAVKQAFNNEVIQLKKNTNQAKIQIIHKLTRKAKTLTAKKAPDHLKGKNKKKAESAVNEVLIMKKLKPKDIARFIITHKGDLNSHLNKPTVDNDKACARLLLHKSLQQKYKTIRNKFGNIPIKDLLMSRQERIKLKNEEKEAQKNKKKNKGKVNSKGDWNVEDVGISKRISSDSKGDDSIVGHQGSDIKNQDSNDGNQSQSDDENNGSDGEKCEVGSNDQDNNSQGDVSDDIQNLSDDDVNMPAARQVVNDSDESDEQETVENDIQDSDDEDMDEDNSDGEVNSEEEILELKNVAKLSKQAKSKSNNFLISKSIEPISAGIEEVLATLKPKKKPEKKVKDNKNKNLNEKMLNRKFKRDDSDSRNAQKVVDPFFKTATGESYMSLAEPRQPDEFKEVHSQGNRQERRAAMFGRAPMKPRRDARQNFRSDKYSRSDANGKFNDGNNVNSNLKFNSNSKYNDRDSSFNDRHSKSNNSNSKFNNNYNNRNSSNDRSTENSNYNNRNSTFKDRNSRYSDNSSFKPTEPKEEKLHPSWEAKKKQSGILPFQGKKTVFDEN